MGEMRWMKFWLTNYIGDASHLTLAEHGAYLLLLIAAWDSPGCSLPADDAWIKRRLRLTSRQYERDVCPVIEEFWTKESGRIYQKRQRKEWESAQIKSEQAKNAAKTRWNVIPLKTKGSK